MSTTGLSIGVDAVAKTKLSGGFREIRCSISRRVKVSTLKVNCSRLLHRACAAACVVTCLLGSPLRAQGPALRSQAKKPEPERKGTESVMTSVPSKTAPELTAADLEAFLDGLMPLQIQHADIAGAVVAVVKDGKLLFSRGYGYSDYEKRMAVSPENTLFRPGSISKLFTWTAVMQQVERGKLDLDRDINDYLDFKIPPAFGKPITLRNVMTHRSGFEETAKDLFVGSEKDLTPVSQYVTAHLPKRIFPPGTTPAYSNYATTLAGYIVQRVAGQPFDDYVDEHIFKPLGMAHATFRQPLPESLKSMMSKGYVLASGGAKLYEYVEAAPAGSVAASAEAMTHFMIAHLQNGRYGDAQILKQETAQLMHSRQDGWPASMNAMALGFYEETQNGQRIIGHAGDTECFHSDLHLILDSNVGFFVSYNSAGRDEISPRTVLFDKFMDRYFPRSSSNEAAPATAAEDARSVTGLYEISRRFDTNILAITTLLGETKIVADPKDNTIFLPDSKGLNGQPTHYREVDPHLFRAVNGHEKIAFVKDTAGRQVAYIDFPFMVFQRVDTISDRKAVNVFILAASAGVIVLALLLWPVGAMIRGHYGKALTLSPEARRLRMLTHIACFLFIAFGLGLVWLTKMGEEPGGLSEAADKWIHLLQVIGVLSGVGAIVAIYNSVKSWKDSNQWFWNKVWNTLLAFGCVGFFWFLYHWHLLNFNLNY
jgi:CubicO group peptidase (beta-lactamase class C family)